MVEPVFQAGGSGRVVVAVGRGAGPVPAGPGAPGAARPVRGLRAAVGAVFRAGRAVRAAAAAESTEVRAALVSGLGVRPAGRRASPGPQQTPGQPQPRSRGLPVHAGRYAVRRARAPQHRPHRARSPAAGWSPGGAGPGNGAGWERRDAAGRGDGGLGHQKNRDGKNHAHLNQDYARLNPDLYHTIPNRTGPTGGVKQTWITQTTTRVDF